METLTTIELNEFQATETENIHLLIFQVMGTKFGVDLDEVYELLEPEQANQRECSLVPFDGKYPFGGSPVDYQSPMVLLGRPNFSSGILIDQAQEIVQIPLDSIKPLPPLIERCKKGGRIWGAILIKNEVVLLVELF